MFQNPQFYQTIGALAVTAIFSVLLGGLARSNFVAKTRPILGLVAAGLFGFALYNSIISVHMHLGWILTVIGCIWSGVFFLGAMVVVNQDLSHQNGSVHIKKNSFLYWFLTKFCLLDPEKPKTLCSISWIGMLAIIVWPIVSVLFTIYSIIVGLFGFIFTGRNPIICVKSLTDPMACGGYKNFKVAMWGKFPAIPGIYLGICGLIYLLIWLTKFAVVITIYKFIALVAIFGIVFFVCGKAFILLGDHKPEVTHNRPSIWSVVYTGALAPTGRAVKTGTCTPFMILVKVIGTIKRKVCPAIVIEEN